jgi:dimethylsulfoniopropionate demethylase
MNQPALSLTRRLRSTPFTRRVNEAGVKAFTIYNHMQLPTVFEGVVEDYRHLKEHVQIWDVSCERQVEIRGRDATRLVQMLTPRDLRRLSIGQCFYVPIVDETGGMLNDPVLLKLADDRYWISIADSDLLFWVKGLAYGLHWEVDVIEPAVYPLAVQGPKADDLMARVFGEQVRDIGFFRFMGMDFEDRTFNVARSGYSKQGGFEIYVDDWDIGERIWDRLMEAGADLNVRAGCPNIIERIEGGLLSYGSDMTRKNTPHECGLGRFCDTVTAIGCIGRDALLRVATEGPVRQIRGLKIDGDPVPLCLDPWPIYGDEDGESELIGSVTSSVWSPDFNTNVSIGMVRMTHWKTGTRVTVETPAGIRTATVTKLPFKQ